MRSILITVVVLALALPAAGCASRPATLPAVPASAETSGSAAAPPSTAGILATAPVGADGVPVVVQREVDRFAAKHVTLSELPAGAAGGGGALRAWAGEGGTRYTFDRRGLLVGFSYATDVISPDPGDSPLSDAQLTAKARAFVRTHFDARQAGWPAQVERRVSGIDQDNAKIYEISVELRERVGGLPGPNYVRLVLSKAGDIVELTRDDGPVKVASTKPRLTKDAAGRLAAKAVGYANPELLSAELRVVREATDGSTLLVWRIGVRPSPVMGGSMHVNGRALVDVYTESGLVRILSKT